MRNPADAVAGMPSSLNLGLRIFAAWERFSKSNPVALETAGAYGTKDCTLGQGVRDEMEGRTQETHWQPRQTQGRPHVQVGSQVPLGSRHHQGMD